MGVLLVSCTYYFPKRDIRIAPLHVSRTCPHVNTVSAVGARDAAAEFRQTFEFCFGAFADRKQELRRRLLSTILGRESIFDAHVLCFLPSPVSGAVSQSVRDGCQPPTLDIPIGRGRASRRSSFS